MTVKPLGVALTAVASLALLGLYLLRTEQAPATTDHEPASAAVAAAPVPRNANVDAEASKQSDSDDPADLADDIGGYALRKDRSCDAELVMLANADGTATEALRCTPRKSVERPYQHYDAVTLRQMAYGDPEAAAELGYRLIDAEPAEGTKYLLRAVALDPAYAVEIETIRHAVYPPEVNVDNQLELAAGSYLFAMLRARIDDDYGPMLAIADAHFRASGGTETERALLEARAAELYEHLRRIRLDVVGDHTLEVSP